MIILLFNILNNVKNKSFKQSYLFLYILNKIDPELATRQIDSSIFYNYIFAIFTLSLIGILSLISAVYMLICIYLINTYNIEDKFGKYPRIVKIINWSKKINTFWIVVELLLVFLSLLVIVSTSFLILGIPFHF